MQSLPLCSGSSSCQSAANKKHKRACKAAGKLLASASSNTCGKRNARKKFKSNAVIEFLVTEAGIRTTKYGPAYGAKKYLTGLVERAHSQRADLSTLAHKLCDEEDNDDDDVGMDAAFGDILLTSDNMARLALGVEIFPRSRRR